MQSETTRRSGGRAAAKYGFPRPRTNGRRYSSITPRSVRHAAKSGPATSMTPSTSAFRRRAKASRSWPTSVALAPTDFSERDATHFGCVRHAAANHARSRPLRSILVPVAHHLVHATTVQTARAVADVVDPITEERNALRRMKRRLQLAFNAGNIAIERLHHSKDNFSHVPAPRTRLALRTAVSR